MIKCKLGELLDVKRGASLSGKYYATKGNLIRLTLGNFNYPNGGFKENEAKEDIFFLGEVKPEFILKEGDIITPLTEQVAGLLGETARIPESNKYIQSGDIGLIIPNETKLNKAFAYYLVSSSIVKKQLGAAAQQTKIRHTSPDKIKDCEVWIPDLNYQEKSGRILDNINNKISNNNKTISELEAMTQTIYDYWFLQFEFPNDEGKTYKSSGGKMVWNEELKKEIPEGWNAKKIGDVLSKIPNTYKYTSSEYKKDGKFPIIDQSNDYICGYTDKEEDLLKLNDCVVFGDHTKFVKYVNFNFARGADGTQILNSSDDKLPNHLLYMQISNIQLVSQGYSRYFKFLKDKYVIIPVKEISDMYINKIKIALKKIRKCREENKELSNLRDFLLPLLMNGQVSFKN